MFLYGDYILNIYMIFYDIYIIFGQGGVTLSTFRACEHAPLLQGAESA